MQSRLGPVVAVVVGLVPASVLVVGLLRDTLGANPIEEATHHTGEWALRFLLLTLAVSPLRAYAGWSALLSYRRLLGLLCFFYACLHLLSYAFDIWFDLEIVIEDMIERPYIIAGASAFACLLPLAVTSTRGWVGRLGARWRQLHRLVYLVGMAAIIHFYWLVKAEVTVPLIYAGGLALLLGLRLLARR